MIARGIRMALDRAYFDDISIEIVKKKYYNANKVDAMLADIRRQALALTEENRQLRQRLDALTVQKDEIGETLLSARTISRQMVEDASRRAHETTDQAEAEAEKTVQEAAAQAEETRQAAEREAEQRLAEADEQARQLLSDAEARANSMLARSEAKERELEDRLHGERQTVRQRAERLCGAVKELLSDGVDQVEAEWQDFLRSMDEEMPATEGAAPADLGDKVGAIARLLELDTEDAGPAADEAAETVE